MGLGFLLAATGACDRLPKGEPIRVLEVRWTGTDSGRISAPATAEWCGAPRLLEIRAIQGDTGVAIAIYPADTLAVRKYQVMAPSKAESLPPAAVVALRWAGETSIRGFQGESGTVELTRGTSGEVSGSLATKALSVADTGRVMISGTFRNLPVQPQTRGCKPSAENPEKGAQPRQPDVH